jgi:hypothetical protein
MVGNPSYEVLNCVSDFVGDIHKRQRKVMLPGFGGTFDIQLLSHFGYSPAVSARVQILCAYLPASGR